MRQVTFAKAQAPFGVGDKRLVPDDVAARLEREGVLSASEPFPPQAALAPAKPTRAALKPERPTGTLDLRIAE